VCAIHSVDPHHLGWMRDREFNNLPSNLHAYLVGPVIVARRIFKLSPASLGQSEFR